MDDKLQELLQAAKARHVSSEEIEAQRVNFAFGNAPDGDCGTIETVRAASKIMEQSEISSETSAK